MNSQHLLIIYDNPMVLCLNPYFSIIFQAPTQKTEWNPLIPGCRESAQAKRKKSQVPPRKDEKHGEKLVDIYRKIEWNMMEYTGVFGGFLKV